MPGLVPGIHVFVRGFLEKDVDGRDKPGHDAERTFGFAFADYRFGSG